MHYKVCILVYTYCTSPVPLCIIIMAPNPLHPLLYYPSHPPPLFNQTKHMLPWGAVQLSTPLNPLIWQVITFLASCWHAGQLIHYPGCLPSIHLIQEIITRGHNTMCHQQNQRTAWWSLWHFNDTNWNALNLFSDALKWATIIVNIYNPKTTSIFTLVS